jgi:hypothetical protein
LLSHVNPKRENCLEFTPSSFRLFSLSLTVFLYNFSTGESNQPLFFRAV